METKRLEGVFSVLSTPFLDNLEVDYDSLNNCMQFALDSKAKGILTTAVSGEFYTLTDEEHYRVVDTIAAKNQGRLPMVIGIVSDSVKQCVEFAKHAEGLGAAGLNLTPPYLESTKWGYNWDATLRFFETICNAVSTPLFIQNSKLLGCDMNAKQVRELAQRFENVQYIKEEGFDMRQNPSRILEAVKDLPETTFKGVMTGSGHYLLGDWGRGACGLMITPEFTDYYVRIWDAYFSGDKEFAKELHRKMSPMIIYENIYWESLAKYVQKKRKIIRTDKVRSTISMFKEVNHREVDRMLQAIEPYYTVHY